MGFNIEAVEYNGTEITPEHVEFVNQLFEADLTVSVTISAIEIHYGISADDAENIFNYCLDLHLDLH